MKPFESFLAAWLEDYITYRRHLGYKEKNLRQTLSYLDRYIVKDGYSLDHQIAKAGPDRHTTKTGWDDLTPSFFLNFRAELKLNPRTINAIFSAIQGFFHYLKRIEQCEQNPLDDIPPLAEHRFIPFVFSVQEVELLLEAIQKRIRKDGKHFLNDLAEYTAILLLARCGLRISEPTRLLLNHLRPKEATIYIEKTKFSKDRLIPVPLSVITQIKNYLAVRKVLLDKDTSPYLLICGKQKNLTRGQIYMPFNRAVKDIGLDQPKHHFADTTFGRPTPHSLRHAFAVNTLKRIKQQGKSPQNALPVLAAYMGHTHYSDTAVYLKVIDSKQRLELLNFAKSRITL